jgi:hypothetical protein
MSKRIEYIPDDDDSIDDGLPRTPKMGPVETERALAILEEMGGTDHIDVATLEAELRFREKIRRARSRRAFDRHPGTKTTEAEMVQYLRQAGAFDRLREDIEKTLVLKMIHEARQRGN